MNIGFLRSSAFIEELQKEMSALEKAGCERIVVDNAPVSGGPAGMLGAVLVRLSAGDTLAVWSLESVADSMSQLIDLALQLEAKNVRFRSLSEGFDTHGRNRAAIKSLLGHLKEFERQLDLRHQSEAMANLARRVGRPKALSPEVAQQARALIKEGLKMDDVAKQFHVSRATLYRYLEDEGA